MQAPPTAARGSSVRPYRRLPPCCILSRSSSLLHDHLSACHKDYFSSTAIPTASISKQIEQRAPSLTHTQIHTRNQNENDVTKRVLLPNLQIPAKHSNQQLCDLHLNELLHHKTTSKIHATSKNTLISTTKKTKRKE